MVEFLLIVIVVYGIYNYLKVSKNKTDKTASQKKKTITKIKTIVSADTLESDEDAYSMFFDVVGESFNNPDGSSRQELIQKYAKVDEAAHLKFYNYKGSLACGVYLDEHLKKQIGHIAKDEVRELYDIVTSGDTIAPIISSVGSNKKGLYGVTIEVLIKEKE